MNVYRLPNTLDQWAMFRNNLIRFAAKHDYGSWTVSTVSSRRCFHDGRCRTIRKKNIRKNHHKCSIFSRYGYLCSSTIHLRFVIANTRSICFVGHMQLVRAFLLALHVIFCSASDQVQLLFNQLDLDQQAVKTQFRVYVHELHFHIYRGANYTGIIRVRHNTL